MKNNYGITMVSLVVTIIILIILAGVSINLTLGDNGLITIAKKAKENMELAQIEEQSRLNELYIQIGKDDGILGNTNIDFLEKLTEFKKKIAEYIEEAGGIKPEYTASIETFGESILGIVKEVTKDATATPEDITKGKTAYVNGEKITGTMLSLEEQTQATATADKILKNYTAYINGKLVTGSMNNHGGIQKTLKAGENYIIPIGYHNGEGMVSVASLASQTQATAVAGQILNGKTAWVNGTKITGTMQDNGAVNQTLKAGSTYTIPAGYHNGTGKITVESLANQTQATATPDKILKDYTAYVNGKYIVGTMTNNGAVNKTLNAGQSYTILPGYHNGSGKVTATSLASQTPGTATAESIEKGKTAWVNGIKITGTKDELNSIKQFLYNGPKNMLSYKWISEATSGELSNEKIYNTRTVRYSGKTSKIPIVQNNSILTNISVPVTRIESNSFGHSHVRVYLMDANDKQIGEIFNSNPSKFSMSEFDSIATDSIYLKFEAELWVRTTNANALKSTVSFSISDIECMYRTK